MPSWLPLQRAQAFYKQGLLLAYPTTGIWGLGCDPFNERAVTQLLALKNRPVHKGLIIVFSQMQHIHGLLAPLHLNAQQQQQIIDSGVNHTSYLVPNNGYFSPLITGRHSNVAIRMSQHPVVKSLCNHLNSPLVSTSANKATHPPCKYSWQVQRAFSQAIKQRKLYVVEGHCHAEKEKAAQASRIKNLLTGECLR